MSVDLGFDYRQNKNTTAIDEFIAKIDRDFDLVMITEYMEASMVLLANLMGWPLEYVTFLKLNARLPGTESYSLTLQDEITLLDLNPIDTLLYDHFLKKFLKCVRQYGEGKMNDQVRQLRKINERFKNRCVAEEVVGANPGNVQRVEYKPKNQSDMECIYSIQVSSVLTNMVHTWQAERLRGGTTIQNVLLRFAIMNSLDVMSIVHHTYYWPFSDSSIIPSNRTPNGKYHILAHHTRYTSKLKSYQYPDTPMTTMLRHPATLFQSLYVFFRMERSTGMSFPQFLNATKKPERIWGFYSQIAYRGYNQMSVDLGFDLQQNQNATAINEFIDKIDREFDLVLIMEHMEESLVLLANLMGWPLEYVAFLKVNARVEGSDSYSLTLQDKTTLLDLNPIDALLYDHFLKKFRKCVHQYGE
ncbi:Galactose-3-O-sulfotransferase, partial [Sarracenia purpurea var. burkii]